MSEIVCAAALDRLMEYLEGVLPADLHAALADHVAGCPRCAAFVAAYCSTPRILREATAAPLPAEIERSLKAFLRARTTAFKSS